ncbi:MAG: hypothetical protein A3I02_08785 [Betaproteobacteria bacterium RIFCSPLOWO2_02_FULL_67_26]|nr:MAG: hypothetical protein A3I02_08785 [Betaproteobacteria bacterium RIFCSPLOWO2_02_FULL_67_26]
MNAPTEKLIGDVKVLANDVEELLKATAAQSGEKIAEARARTQAAIARARTVAVEQGRQAAQTTDQYVRDNPWAAIGVSAAIGLLVGLLIGRR